MTPSSQWVLQTQALSTSLRTVRRLGNNSVKEGSTSNNVEGRILYSELSESICFLFNGSSSVTLQELGMSSATGNWKAENPFAPQAELWALLLFGDFSDPRHGSDQPSLGVTVPVQITANPSSTLLIPKERSDACIHF